MAATSFNAENKTIGYFTEKDYGKVFDYYENPEVVFHVPAHGGRLERFPHMIYVGPHAEETRMALVKGTVAHVVIDEQWRDGRPWFVVEKWNIKKHRRFAGG